MRCTIVVPAPPGLYLPAGSAARLLAHLRRRALAFSPDGVQTLLVDVQGQVARQVESGCGGAVRSPPAGSPHAVVNAAFLLQDVPPFEALRQACSEASVAACATPASDDLFGVCWQDGAAAPAALWNAVRLLCCTPEQVQAHGVIDSLGIPQLVAPGGGSCANSPTLRSTAAVARRSAHAPVYLNAAFRELLRPRAPAAGEGEAAVVAELAGLRTRSAVPWIFNALLSDVEHRLGATELASLPPEMHLSSTGLCNLECRFCAYTRKNALREFVVPQQVAQMDFLDWVQTLRLSSGLGEPTLNRHLPEIIGQLSQRFPHLCLNFFTNGIALHRPGLIPALLDAVGWINVSLNAASAASWRLQHQADHFDRVRANLVALRDAKREQGCLLPVVHASTVLNGHNAADLPRMPALCRELGIDRLSAFPYSALGYDGVAHTFGPEQALERFRDRYDALYERTVAAGREHAVSVELPRPAVDRAVRFGLEQRVLHDFAGIERKEWSLAELGAVLVDRPSSERCGFLWRIGCVGSTHGGSRSREDTHYMYPCIGPLSSAELSLATPFRFPGREEMRRLWNSPVFQRLRRAQDECGVSPVCDHCRQRDSRDPAEFATLQRLVAQFTEEVDALGADAPPSA